LIAINGIEYNIAENKLDGSFIFFHPSDTKEADNSLSVGGIFFTNFIYLSPIAKRK
jgi:hypothetical protein